MQPFVDIWQIHNRINLYLLNGIEETSLADISALKGRSVRKHFAHMHNERLMWFKAAAPDLLEKLVRIEKTAVTKELLRANL